MKLFNLILMLLLIGTTGVSYAAAPALDEGVKIQYNGADLDVGSHAAVASADWNNDGKMDLIVGYFGNNVRLYLNTGTSNAPAFSSYSNLQAGGITISVSGY